MAISVHLRRHLPLRSAADESLDRFLHPGDAVQPQLNLGKGPKLETDSRAWRTDYSSRSAIRNMAEPGGGFNALAAEEN